MEQTLADQIKVLIDLQKIDSKIYGLNIELAQIPETKESRNQAFEAKKIGLKTAEDDLKQVQLRQKELETEALSKDDLVKKFQSQQAQVKTNQEYTALTHEIQNATADKSVAEDEVLKLMDETEQKKLAVQEARAEIVDIERAHLADIKTLEDRAKSIEDEIAQLDGERQKFTPSVDEELLAQYQRILVKRDGVAVVELQGESCCGGCSLNFPPQVVNEIKLQEHVTFCESCSRIVYEERT